MPAFSSHQFHPITFTPIPSHHLHTLCSLIVLGQMINRINNTVSLTILIILNPFNVLQVIMCKNITQQKQAKKKPLRITKYVSLLALYLVRDPDNMTIIHNFKMNFYRTFHFEQFNFFHVNTHTHTHTPVSYTHLTLPTRRTV